MNSTPALKSYLLYISVATVMLLTFAVYYQVTGFDFINLDDNKYIIENSEIQKGFNLDTLKWALTTNYYSSWQPVTWLSYQLDFSIYGLNPAGYHLTNLIIHILSSIVLFFMLKLATGSDWKSFFITSLFALHPLHVESVAWIAERKDVLFGFFWFSTMYFYTKYVHSTNIKYYWIAFLTFLLGIMSKPTIMTLPFVLMLFDYWPLNRFSFTVKNILTSAKEKTPFFLITIFSILMTLKAQSDSAAIVNTENITITERVANTFVTYIEYLTTTIIPTDLGIFYPYNIDSTSFFEIIVCVILFLSITYFAISKFDSQPYFIVGWLWFVGVLVPNIGLVQVGVQSHADRYMYIPIVGLAIIIAFGTEHLIKNNLTADIRKLVATTAITFSIIAMASLTFLQTKYWADSFSVFSRAVDVTGDNYTAQNNLAVALIEKKQFREAIVHLEASLAIYPDYPQALLNIGLAYMHLNETTKALKYFKKSLEKEYTSISHSNIGLLYLKENNAVEAEKYFLESIKVDNQYGPPYYYLATLYITNNRIAEAITMADKYTKAVPSNPDGFYMLGYALTLSDNNKLALIQFEKVLELAPKNKEAQKNIEILKTKLASPTKGKP